MKNADIKGKKVLITGSEGFVGGHLWKEMENQGYEVYGTTLSPKNIKNTRVFVCDITNRNQVIDLFVNIKPDYVAHLAAFTRPGESVKNSDLTFEINIEGTKNILDGVRALNSTEVRTLIIGSSEEFGLAQNVTTITEDSPLSPITPYGFSKTKSWELALEYLKEFSLDIVSAIPFNHTGPGQSSGFISSDIASQIVEIEKGQQNSIIVTGQVDHERNISDVRDVVRAYRLLLEKGKNGERYIICADRNIKLTHAVNTLLNLSKVKIKHHIDTEKFKRTAFNQVNASHKKITDELGWTPEISIEKTLVDLLEYYRQKG